MNLEVFDEIFDFVRRVDLVQKTVRKHSTGTDYRHPIEGLTLVTPSGERVRELTLDGVGELIIHGIGCEVTMLDGAIVDFDWLSDGRPVIDLWKVRLCASDEKLRPIEEYSSAAQFLVDSGDLEKLSKFTFARPKHAMDLLKE